MYSDMAKVKHKQSIKSNQKRNASPRLNQGKRNKRVRYGEGRGQEAQKAGQTPSQTPSQPLNTTKRSKTGPTKHQQQQQENIDVGRSFLYPPGVLSFMEPVTCRPALHSKAPNQRQATTSSLAAPKPYAEGGDTVSIASERSASSSRSTGTSSSTSDLEVIFEPIHQKNGVLNSGFAEAWREAIQRQVEGQPRRQGMNAAWRGSEDTDTYSVSSGDSKHSTSTFSSSEFDLVKYRQRQHLQNQRARQQAEQQKAKVVA